MLLEIDGYEGPLDVLLELAKNQKIDITKISILELVNQYLDFIKKAKILNPTYPFDIQVANVYRQMGDSEKMITSYLSLIQHHPNQKQSVKNKLQIFLNNDGIESSKNYNILHR